MSRMKNLVFVAAISLLMIPSSSESWAAQQEAPIKIAHILPYTGKGADWGKKGKIDADLALEDINRRGGINGHPLEIITYDSAGSVEQAVLLARKAAQEEKVFFILGPYFSSEDEVCFPIANELKVPMVGPTSAKPNLAANNRPWTFRNTATNDKIVGPSVDAFLKRYSNVRRMAIVVDLKDAWSKNLGLDIFPEFLKARGIDIVTGTNPIAIQTGATDVSAQVTKLKYLNVDAVAMAPLYMDSATFALEMKRQGLQIPVLSSMTMVQPAFIEITKGAAEGWIGSSTFWPDNPDATAQNFIRRFEKVANEITPHAPFPGYADPNIYDAIIITAQIMRANDITPDTPLEKARDLIREGWQNLRDYKGIAGTVSILPNGEGDLKVWPIEVKSGKFQTIQKKFQTIQN